MWALIKFIPPKLLIAIAIASIAFAMGETIHVQHKRLQSLKIENTNLQQDYKKLTEQLTELEKLKEDMQTQLKAVKTQTTTDEKAYEQISKNNQDWTNQLLPNGIDRLLN